MEITRQVLLDASADEVWAELVDEDARADWLGERRAIEILSAEPGRSLRWRWSDPAADRRGEGSTVTIELEETDDGRTQLTVTERAGASACTLGPATVDVEAWDRRLLGLELRCLARPEALTPV
jgi:uncharacterized protein YndB with AHSA1/START domain